MSETSSGQRERRQENRNKDGENDLPIVPESAPPRWGKVVFSVGVAAFVVAMCLPGTGWLPRLQTKMLTGNGFPAHIIQQVVGGTGGNDSALVDMARKQTASARNVPDDFEMQIAIAVSNISENAKPKDGEDAMVANRHQNDRRLDNLRALETRFTYRPELYATELRYACMSYLTGVARNEDWQLGGYVTDPAEQKKMADSYEQKRKRLNATILTRLETAAASGERCDPQNAFFPQMLAAILFSQNRDSEAIAALHRAGSRTLWRDYSTSELTGRFRLIDRTEGEVGTMPRMAVSAALLFPHYATLRSLARVSTVIASEKEKRGDHEGGLAIRQDIGRIGALMRVQGTSLISSLVGIATVAISGSQPEGVILPKPEGDSDLNIARRLDAYISYLNRIGHKDEAVWFLAEREKDYKAKSIVNHQNNTVWDMGRMILLLGLWMISLLLLGSAVWSLVVGGVATFVTRLPHFRRARPLPRGIPMGFIASAILGVMTLVLAVSRKDDGIPFETVMSLSGPGFLTLTIMLCLLKHKADWPTFGWNLLRFVLTIVGTGAVITAICFAFATVIGGYFGAMSLFQGMQGSGERSNAILPALLILGMLLVWGGGLLSGLIVMAVTGKKKGLPVNIALVRGLRNGAVGTAGILLLANVLLSLPLVTMENGTRQEMDEMLKHEGKYLARIANSGDSEESNGWPGLVGEKKN